MQNKREKGSKDGGRVNTNKLYNYFVYFKITRSKKNVYTKKIKG